MFIKIAFLGVISLKSEENKLFKREIWSDWSGDKHKTEKNKNRENFSRSQAHLISFGRSERI